MPYSSKQNISYNWTQICLYWIWLYDLEFFAHGKKLLIDSTVFKGEIGQFETIHVCLTEKF